MAWLIESRKRKNREDKTGEASADCVLSLARPINFCLKFSTIVRLRALYVHIGR